MVKLGIISHFCFRNERRKEKNQKEEGFLLRKVQEEG